MMMMWGGEEGRNPVDRCDVMKFGVVEGTAIEVVDVEYGGRRRVEVGGRKGVFEKNREKEILRVEVWCQQE